MPVRALVEVPEFAREILRESRVEGNRLLLPQQLDRGIYRKVDKVIAAMGGRWDRRARAHVFPEDPAQVIAAAVADGSTPKATAVTDAYYATPDRLAEQIVTGTHSAIPGLGAGARVLEPSAGDGALVRAILAVNPNVHVTAVEPDSGRAGMIGSDPRVEVAASTFEDFAADASERFAAVVMNSPFALPGQSTIWIDHLHAAWNLLIGGGALLAIAPSGYTFRTDRRHRAIRELVTAHGGHQALPPGAFTTSGTDVNTVLLHARRPADR
ncbi:hypothetical protein ACWEKT_38970 [Nocardia takedensis]